MTSQRMSTYACGFKYESMYYYGLAIWFPPYSLSTSLSFTHVHTHTHTHTHTCARVRLRVYVLNAGRDSEPQRGGGTWLGISRHGNFSTLTNYRINMENYKVDALGRGWYCYYCTSNIYLCTEGVVTQQNFQSEGIMFHAHSSFYRSTGICNEVHSTCSIFVQVVKHT